MRPVSTQRDIPRHPVPPLKDTLTKFVRLYCIITCFINSLTDCVVIPSVIPYTNKLHVLHDPIYDKQKGSVVVFKQFTGILSTLGGAEVTV